MIRQDKRSSNLDLSRRCRSIVPVSPAARGPTSGAHPSRSRKAPWRPHRQARERVVAGRDIGQRGTHQRIDGPSTLSGGAARSRACSGSAEVTGSIP